MLVSGYKLTACVCHRDLDRGGSLLPAVDGDSNCLDESAWGDRSANLTHGLPFPSMSAAMSKFDTKSSGTLSSQTVCQIPVQGV